MILSIDQATVTGWCALDGGAAPAFGSLRLASRDSGLGEVLSVFRNFLINAIEAWQPRVLVFESPYIPVARVPRLVKSGTFPAPPAGSANIPMNAITVMRLASLAGLIEMIAFERSLECRQVTAGQATKFLTGSARWGGRAQKKQATVESCKRLGYAVANDNEADAVAIALLAESVLFPDNAARRSIMWATNKPGW